MRNGGPSEFTNILLATRTFVYAMRRKVGS